MHLVCVPDPGSGGGESTCVNVGRGERGERERGGGARWKGGELRLPGRPRGVKMPPRA